LLLRPATGARPKCALLTGIVARKIPAPGKGTQIGLLNQPKPSLDPHSFSAEKPALKPPKPLPFPCVKLTHFACFFHEARF